MHPQSPCELLKCDRFESEVLTMPPDSLVYACLYTHYLHSVLPLWSILHCHSILMSAVLLWLKCSHLQTGVTPLFITCDNGHLLVVECLIAAKANVNTPKEVGCFSITWCRSIRLYHLTLKWCIQIAVMGDGRGAIARFSCPSTGVATLVLLLISLGHGTCKSCCQAFFYWQNEF